MSDYGEGLSLGAFCDIYGKMLQLSDKSKRLLSKGYKWSIGENHDSVEDAYKSADKVDEINNIFNPYAIDMPFLCELSIDKIACYNPKIAKSFMYGDSSKETHYDYSRLCIGFINDYSVADSDIYSALDKFCPNILNSKSWSNPKQLSNDFKTFISKIFVDTIFAGKIVHLYMKGNTPVVDTLFESKDSIHNGAVDKLVSKVVDTFGTNIKEVYISFNIDNLQQYKGMLDMLLSGEVIARRNNDGELTLTIY